MTIREIFAALWRRKWLIVAVMVLSGIVAAVYLHQLTPNYESTATVRLSPVASEAAATGQLGGITVNADPSVITSAAVLDSAAKAAGEPSAALLGAVSYAAVPTSNAGVTTTTSLNITVRGPSAEQAQKRTSAVVTSFGRYLDALVATTLKSLQSRYGEAAQQAVTYRNQLAGNPNDPVVQANLANATTNLTTLNGQISALQNAGASVTVTAPAPLGTSMNPSLTIVVALALVCGLIAGAGVALVRDHFDERLRDDEFEELEGISLLGTLPNDRAVARRRERLPAASARRTALSEGLRSLRTSVQVLLPGGKGVLAVTSVEPGDGKTFVCANLALSWARSGRKVILVGGDLRRPELGKYFENAAHGKGLGDLLTGAEDGGQLTKAMIAEALQTTPYRGLRVLPSGEGRFGEPADLLASAPLERIVRHLAKMADIVLIDTPPSLALADASELAAYAEGTIVLAAVGRTRKSLIFETVDGLRANGVTVLGLVLNRSQRRLPRSYTSYYVSSRRHGLLRPEPDRMAATSVDRRGDASIDELEDDEAMIDEDVAAPAHGDERDEWWTDANAETDAQRGLRRGGRRREVTDDTAAADDDPQDSDEPVVEHVTTPGAVDEDSRGS